MKECNKQSTQLITLGQKTEVTLGFADDRYLGIVSASCDGRFFAVTQKAKN